jgi:hypothetical protein
VLLAEDAPGRYLARDDRLRRGRCRRFVPSDIGELQQSLVGRQGQELANFREHEPLSGAPSP